MTKLRQTGNSKHSFMIVINRTDCNNHLLHYSKWGTTVQIGRSLVRSQLVSLEFFIDIKSFRSNYGPGVDSASNRNTPGGNGGRCVRLTTLPPSCAVVTKSGNRNFLEPSGSVQASLPLPLHYSKRTVTWQALLFASPCISASLICSVLNTLRVSCRLK